MERSSKPKFFITRAAAPTLPASRGSTRTMRSVIANESLRPACGERALWRRLSRVAGREQIVQRHHRVVLIDQRRPREEVQILRHAESPREARAGRAIVFEDVDESRLFEDDDAPSFVVVFERIVDRTQ